jgi:hypothetical protein
MYLKRTISAGAIEKQRKIHRKSPAPPSDPSPESISIFAPFKETELVAQDPQDVSDESSQ